MSASPSLPLLPLPSVLLPGAVMSVRMLEPRYLDLLRESGRNDTGFGACLRLQAPEAGTAAIGTHARIEDFANGADGLLTLRLRGGRRFQVRRTRVRDNGLILTEVDWRDVDGDDELRPEHATLALVLGHMLDQLGGEHAQAARLDDAAWVGWRLAELLPLAERHRQALLQEDDPHARLDRLLTLVA
jgi:Lon protease-like protein